MNRLSRSAAWTAVLICMLGSCAAAADKLNHDEQAIKEVLANFEHGDPGWRVRMNSLVQATKTGRRAVPSLITALENGNTPVREFAAQALAILADSRSSAALQEALNDPDRGVRIYAVRALSAIGELKLTEEYRAAMRAPSGAWKKAPWMPGYLRAAETADRAPNPTVTQRALLEFDLARMDKARLGHPAPDFVLVDRQGMPRRLSDFRGKAVVLEFNVGDG